MQHFTFEISGYDQISGLESNPQGDISARNETEPDSNHPLSLDQILTNFCDVTPSESFAYFPASTSTNADSLNSLLAPSFDNIPQRTIGTSDAYILETPQSSFYKHTSEPDDGKHFTGRTVLLPNPKSPPCYFQPVSDGGNLQCSDSITWTEEFVNANFSDGYFQMRLINERSEVAPKPFVLSCPQVDNIYNYEKNPECGFRSNWWERHPDTWSLPDVLDWIKCTIHRNTVNPTYQSTDGFKDLTSGVCLRHMTYEEFLFRDTHYGHLLFHSFSQLLKFHTHAPMGPDIRDIFSSRHSGHVDSQMYQMSPITPNAQYTPANTSATARNGSDNASSYTNLIVPKYEVRFNETDAESRVDVSGSLSNSTGSSGRALKTFEHFQNPKRKPGRPRLHPCFRTPVIGNKKMKILPLWEFIYSTLQNVCFNPSVIKWEDEANGKFRFVHSEKFAKLWGNVKNNDNMNYEKLSRAMRHYYGRDIMERVEGRRLVYRFLNPALERLRKKEDPDVPLSETQRTPEVIRSI